MRDYKKEYREYHGTKEQLRRRSSRNKARRRMEKDGLVRKGDGKDVDHKDGNPLNNSRTNLHTMSASKNRSKK
jgi:hypothetical protein